MEMNSSIADFRLTIRFFFSGQSSVILRGRYKRELIEQLRLEIIYMNYQILLERAILY
jgi:hypothetical protein